MKKKDNTTKKATNATEPLAYLIGSLVEFGMDTLWPDKNGYPPIGPIEGMIDNVRHEKKSKVAASH